MFLLWNELHYLDKNIPYLFYFIAFPPLFLNQKEIKKLPVVEKLLPHIFLSTLNIFITSRTTKVLLLPLIRALYN